MHLENTDHHRRERAAGKTQRQQRDHSRTSCRIIGGFRRDDAFKFALTEFFRGLRPAHRFVITHERGQRSADAGQNATEKTDENGANNRHFVGQ